MCLTVLKATNQQDFDERGITGFIRSSPAYRYDPCKRMSEAYFDRFMNNTYHEYIPQMAQNVEKLNQYLNDTDQIVKFEFRSFHINKCFISSMSCK